MKHIEQKSYINIQLIITEKSNCKYIPRIDPAFLSPKYTDIEVFTIVQGMQNIHVRTNAFNFFNQNDILINQIIKLINQKTNLSDQIIQFD